MIQSGTSRWLALAVGATAALSGQQTIAADQAATAELAEVVVTAERREVDLQKTALSVTAISAQQVEKTGVTSYADLLESIPGVQVQAAVGPVTTPYIAVRGLGTDGDNKPGATAVYLDGITVGSWGGQLYDLARIEVLRGPQGTLYGGVATGGALNIISNNPSLEGYAGSGQLEIGNYGLVHATAMYNAPLSDRVALRVAANSQKRHQYSSADNAFLDTLNARAKLLFEASEQFSMILGLEVYRSSGVNSDGFQTQDNAGNLTGSYQPTIGYSSGTGNKAYLQFDWDTSIGTLTSISAVQKYSGDENSMDAMGSMNTHFDRRDTTTQELRLASNNDGPVSWVAGLYYRDYQQRDSVNIGATRVLPVDSTIPFSAPFFAGPTANNNIIKVPELRDDQSLGVFGQVTAKLGDNTRLTGGLRYSKDDIHFDQFFSWNSFLAALFCNPPAASCMIPTYFKKSFKSTDYLVRFEHDLSADNLIYATASTGYRPGGAGAPRTSTTDPLAVYDKERVKSYEIGTKNRFLDNRVQLNGAIYYNDYPSFQNNLTFWGPANARATSVVGVPATISGAELELQTVITPNDRLSASASYIKSKYTSDAVTANPFPPSTPVALATNGKQLPHAPKTQFNLGYDHTFPVANGGKVVWDISGHYQSEQAIAFDSCLYSGSNTTTACVAGGTTIQMWLQPSYSQFDTSFSYSSEGDKFTATLYARNLTDKIIKIGTAANSANLGAPRTVGVVLGAKF